MCVCVCNEPVKAVLERGQHSGNEAWKATLKKKIKKEPKQDTKAEIKKVKKEPKKKTKTAIKDEKKVIAGTNITGTLTRSCQKLEIATISSSASMTDAKRAWHEGYRICCLR